MPNKIPAHIQAMLDELHALRAELEENDAEVLRLEDRQNEIRRLQDIINGQIAASELPALYAEKAANEEKIADLQERKRFPAFSAGNSHKADGVPNWCLVIEFD